MERARRGYLKLLDRDKPVFPPEGRSAGEHLVELCLASKGDELAAGTARKHVADGYSYVDQLRLADRSGSIEAIVVITEQGDFPDFGAAAEAAIDRGAEAIVADLRAGATDMYIDPDSIVGFGSVGWQKGWRAGYFGVECPVGDSDDFWTEWEFAAPIKQILAVLDALETQGWRVARVSEDRGLFQGSHTDNDSAVTTIRHWLVRS